MAQVRCEVSKGLRKSEATALVKDIKGERHYLPVDREFLTEENGQFFLPVGVVHIDEAKKAALVELPLEADSGTSRIWVNVDSLSQLTETPT